MKKVLLMLMLLLSLLFVQCDTAERRQSKAEDLIKKHLFETLDNFNSHELISIKLDTLHRVWLASPQMIELGNEYLSVQANYYQLESEISDLEDRIKSSQQAAVRSLFNGNGGGFWSQAINIQDIKERISTKQADSKVAYINMRTLGDSLVANNQRLEEANDFAGWYVTYKFRYTDSSGEPRIHTEYHILNPKLSEILYSWDEDDYSKMQMIKSVNDAIQNHPQDWRLELEMAEDELKEEEIDE